MLFLSLSVKAELIGPWSPDVAQNKGSVSQPPAEFYMGVYARTISTYPMLLQTDKRVRVTYLCVMSLQEGDPICDRFKVQIYNNRVTLVVCDGCNWGIRPHTAAVKASQAFLQLLHQKHRLANVIMWEGYVCDRCVVQMDCHIQIANVLAVL